MISIRNLNIYYHNHSKNHLYALKNIFLDIPKNRITVIMGPSGCGKTTLLKSLNRLHSINNGVKVNGQVIISGEDIYHPRQRLPELRKNVGLIPQKPIALPMSIYDNVSYGPSIHAAVSKKEMDHVVEKSLKRVHLWDEVKFRLSAPAADLSVGQLQRLSIARAIAINPKVLLCDEITSALDPVSSEKVEHLLLEIKNEYTIVVVSHMLRQVRRLADYVIFLYLGEVIEHGEVEQIFNSPQNEITREYIKGIFS